MTIAQFLADATKLLAEAGVTTARLDTLVLLADTFKKDKSWLLAHQDETIPPHELAELVTHVKVRSKRVPLAYVRGVQEFYGREFTVTPSVLIPRPETEAIVTELKRLPLQRGPVLLDVGTGSGAIAATAALELRGALVEASDIDQDALDIARANAKQLRAPIARFFLADLLDDAGFYDVIIANLPYVDQDWERSPETAFEPKTALFAEDNGLALIKKLLQQAPDHLTPEGYLILEADPRQFAAIKKAAPSALACIREQGFVLVFQKQN